MSECQKILSGGLTNKDFGDGGNNFHGSVCNLDVPAKMTTELPLCCMHRSIPQLEDMRNELRINNRRVESTTDKQLSVTTSTKEASTG